MKVGQSYPLLAPFVLSLTAPFVLSQSKDESLPPARVILARESIVTVAGFLYSPPARSMPLSSRLPSSIGGLVLTSLLAIPFAIIGPALFYRVLWTVTTATTRQAWPTVPATLQRVELVPSGGSTVKVSASYTYAVAGHQYTGTHVSLYGPDSPGGAQSKAYDELEEYVARQAPYPAHVNPVDPSDAILMPVIRWQTIGFMSLFATVFGGVGWGLLIACVQAYFKRKAEAALIAQHPNEPWLQRLEWAGPRIQSDQESLASGTLIAAIMWNLFSAPMLIAVPEKLRQREWIGLLLLVFPAVGVFLIYWAGVSIMRARRFGKTFLDLETRPGRQGEHLRGRIFAPAALGSASAVDLVVACVQYRKSATSSRSSGTSAKRLWEQKVAAEVFKGQVSNGDVVIPLDVALPADLPDSSRGVIEWHEWTLEASAKLPGADFEAEFEIPVFTTQRGGTAAQD